MTRQRSHKHSHLQRVGGVAQRVRGGNPARAPLEPEHREVLGSAPHVLTQGAIDDWAATDPELAQMRFEQRHGVLY